MVGFAAAGVGMRLWWLFTHGLTPDDALQAMLARQPSFAQALAAGSIVHHPPMIVALDYLIQGVWYSDVSIRLVPALCGVAMPVVFYFWIRRHLGTPAAAITFLLVLFSPSLFSLSVQSRGYAIAFLLAVTHLYLLDSAVWVRSALRMTGAIAALWLAILTDFSMAVLCVSIGCYALVRLVEGRACLRLWTVWVAGQLAGIAIYSALWVFQVQHLVRNRADETQAEWLHGLFPVPGENLVWFTARGTMHQFNFLMSSLPLSVGAAAAFIAGAVLIWRYGRRPILILAVLPFLLQWLASLAILLPYGPSRHSSLLALMAAIGVAASVNWLPRRHRSAAVALLAGLIPFWWKASRTNPYDLEPERLRGVASVATFIRQAVPPGSYLLATGEANAVLGFYLRADRWKAQPRTLNTVQQYAGYTVFSEQLAFHNFAEWCGHLTDMLASHHLSADRPIWVVDGGFYPSAASRIRADFGPAAISDIHRFGYLIAYRIVPARILPHLAACTLPRPNPTTTVAIAAGGSE